MCGALAWLHNTSKLPDDFCREGKRTPDNPLKAEKNIPSWLMDDTDTDFELGILSLVFLR